MLTEFLLIGALLCLALLFFFQHKQSNERFRSRRFVFSSSLLLAHSAHIVVCAFAHFSIPFTFMLVVVGLSGMCYMYFLVYVCVIFLYI